MGFLRALLGLPNRPRMERAEPADFVAIDFETANETRASACAVGVALVKDGVVSAAYSSLINPETYFNPYNQMVHGISEVDVASAPTFPQLWPQLAPLLAGQDVVAHHAPFDMAVLRSMAARYHLPGPSFSVYCSRRLAKVTWPDLDSYSLGWLASELGIAFTHHVAAEDAAACGLVAAAICQSHGAADLSTLSRDLGFIPGRITPASYEPFRVEPGTYPGLTAVDGDPNADVSHPLYDKTVCFTGTLASMIRREARDHVTAVGGHFRNTVSRQLDYLVIGDADFAAFADGWTTTKLARTRELRAEGFAIEIIPEWDFLELLRGD